MSYSPAQMASMLEAVKDTPPAPELPLGGWLAELDGMTLKYAFERKVGELLVMNKEAPVNAEHVPFDYRPEGESRHTVPAEVCFTCSDFEAGRLVPVCDCSLALARSDELTNYIRGLGPHPTWLPAETP